MKKRILCRALIGAPIGLAISTAITIFSSLIYGDGNYYPVVPALVEQCGNEINAVVAQMIASLLYGAVWAGASVIWEPAAADSDSSAGRFDCNISGCISDVLDET